MDGTTAGSLGALPPVQPQTAPASGNLLNITHAAPVPPVTPPLATPATQFSQVTPVYAPGPTNTVADIPQPAVKGIEFIQPSTTPVPSIPPLPSAAGPVISMPQPSLPTPSTLPPSARPVLSPTVPIQPVPQPIAPIAPTETPLPSAQSIGSMSGAANYKAIENRIQDLDLDQIVGTPQTLPPVAPAPVPAPVPELPKMTPIPTPLVTPPSVPVQAPVVVVKPAAPIISMPAAVPPKPVTPPTPPPVAPVSAPIVTPEPITKQDVVRNYFANASSATPDAPIGSTGAGRPPIDPGLLRRIVIIAGIVIVLGVGGFFGVNAIIGSQKSQTATTTKPTTTVPQPDFSQPATDTSTTDTTTTSTPSDTTTPPAITDNTPSTDTTTTPATDASATTSVPKVANTGVSDDYASLPGYLDISKLGIHAPVEQVGVTSTGAMGVPSSIWDAGWYIGSAKPGQSGAAFMDGHSSSAGGALFGKLDTLAVGDSIKVERNDGIVVSYKVAKVSVVNRNDVDMTSMLKPYDPHKNGLNIMSCQGQWIASEGTLENRVLVYAVQID